MRSRSLLLPLAGLLAAVHVVGVLTAAPILRYAEVLAVAVLLAYALLAGLPSPRWVVPVGLIVVAVDAWWTMPVDPAEGGYRWQVLEPGPPPEFTDGLWTGLALTWAALFFVLLLAVVSWPQTDRRPSGRLSVGALLAAAAVVGYVVFRLAGYHGGQPRVAAVAVLAPLALALAAVLLAALLVRRGHRLAAGGAVLLLVAALFQFDAALAPYTLLPLSPNRGTLLTGAMAGPALVTMPALTAAAELAGYLLLVAGLRARRTERSRGQPGPAAG
ncbi:MULTISPECIES: hypothetical protein [Micromonospora]|uniref:Lycopene cyclase domain-containing protein n=1 Tax=Micromonospora gifhornensis TaxID=84594 RepID=A0ABQ4I800_9ACTN|nr:MULTISPECIES: hypothetical protein [Micromonospora]PMR62243.1 hypothetical protein C1A38_04450 [Verrucosispora sp. ts21]GIJ14027.1 hypothetical protein Vgi01_07110 [Micromonospora gifhornensis]